MKPEHDLPIEPLSEAAFARVEAAVFHELDSPGRVSAPALRRRPRRLSLALVAAIALPVGAVLALVWRDPAVPTRTAGPDITLSSTRIVANDTSTDTLLGDVSIHLEPGASLVAVRDGVSGSLVLLERGSAHFAVPPRAHRPFTVQAADVTVEVVGTRFSVTRVEARGASAREPKVEARGASAREPINEGAVRVHTTEGVVRVMTLGRTVLLPAGASFDSAASSSPSGLPTQSTTEQPLRTAGDVDAGVHSLADAATPTPQSLRVASASDPRERFEQASRLEVSAPATALRIYASLVARGGRWSEPALYAQGRLELEQGHRESAAKLLRRYLREHPEGANASDVRLLLTRSSASAPNEPTPRLGPSPRVPE